MCCIPCHCIPCPLFLHLFHTKRQKMFEQQCDDVLAYLATNMPSNGNQVWFFITLKEELHDISESDLETVLARLMQDDCIAIADGLKLVPTHLNRVRFTISAKGKTFAQTCKYAEIAKENERKKDMQALQAELTKLQYSALVENQRIQRELLNSQLKIVEFQGKVVYMTWWMVIATTIAALYYMFEIIRVDFAGLSGKKTAFVIITLVLS